MSRIVRFAGKTPFSVHIIPVLSDNYSYLVIEDATGEAMAVDPVEPAKIAEILKSSNFRLSAIATTHHHDDHAGGNIGLHKLFSSSAVYGFDERIPALTKRLPHRGTFSLGGLRIQTIHNPCHTSGSLSYVVHDDKMAPSEQAVFTGDTLFIAGCGRFFEGSAEEMHEALCKKLGALPPKTAVFVGHEYTIKNLEFAASVEPENRAVQEKLLELKEHHQKHGSVISVPSSIEEEWKINPFMRLSSSAAICKGTGHSDEISVMRALREMKNNFK